MDNSSTKIYRSGRLRADKIQYKDGIGCCVWYPLPLPAGKEIDNSEDSGLCFDFAFDDLEDFIQLLETLRDAPAQELLVEPEDGE